MPTFNLIVAIVNQGYSEELMDAVREHGARGGTIINARGTARADAEKIFNIAIHPEKEIVLILATDKIVDELLHVIYKTVGLETQGQGIAFALPVNDVVGLQSKEYKKQLDKLYQKVKEEKAQQEASENEESNEASDDSDTLDTESQNKELKNQ